MPYNDNLEADAQITAEEQIASLIFTYTNQSVNESDCAELGRQILLQVLEQFRPDLIASDDGYTPSAHGCGRKIETPTGLSQMGCGNYWAGEMQLCGPCLAVANRDYPQGWRGYPGDTCKHGVYVGGCMEDFMCGRCENGD